MVVSNSIKDIGKYSPMLQKMILEKNQNNIPVIQETQNTPVEIKKEVNKLNNTNNSNDTFVQTKTKKEKKSFFEKLANFIGSVKKFFVNLKEYSIGSFKGTFAFLGSALATVGTIFTADKVINAVKSTKEAGTSQVIGKTFENIGKGISKNITKDGILKTVKSTKGIGTLAAALAVGIVAFSVQMFKAKLKANEQKALIDHKYKDTPIK